MNKYILRFDSYIKVIEKKIYYGRKVQKIEK